MSGRSLVDELPTELQRLLVDRRKAAQRPAVAIPADFTEFADEDALVREALGMVASGVSVACVR